MKKMIGNVLGEISGDLITTDIEVQSLNRQYANDYDGYILTPQNVKTVKSHLYGFYGLPLDNTLVYLVTTYYR